jgi:hypothetical protein
MGGFSFLRKSLNTYGSIPNDKAVDLRNPFLKTQIQRLIQSFFFSSRPFYLALTKLNFQIFRWKIIPHDNVASDNTNTFKKLVRGSLCRQLGRRKRFNGGFDNFLHGNAFHDLAHWRFFLQPTSCRRIEGLQT